MQTVLEQWNDFRKSLVPADAPQVQVDHMQLAFYAGVQSSLATLVLVGGAATDEEGAHQIAQSIAEVRLYFDALANTLGGPDAGAR